jgi:hypothetical protein
MEPPLGRGAMQCAGGHSSIKRGASVPTPHASKSTALKLALWRRRDSTRKAALVTEHVLKTWGRYWDRVASGEKTFEVRRDDRGFQKGDILILRRTDDEPPYYYTPGSDGRFSTRDLRKRVSWILTGGQFGIEPGHVVMALTDE